MESRLTAILELMGITPTPEDILLEQAINTAYAKMEETRNNQLRAYQVYNTTKVNNDVNSTII